MQTHISAVLGVGVLGRIVLGDIGKWLDLITDRTAEDVRLGNKKGVYGADDLNRVGDAVRYVSDRFMATGNDIKISPKIDWILEDIPTSAQMDSYLDQVRKVRDVLSVYQTTPLVPSDMVNLTYGQANDIEKILVDVDQLITNMIAAYYYSGELYGGEV